MRTPIPAAFRRKGFGIVANQQLTELAKAATDASLALSKIAAADGTQPGHVAYLSKAAMSEIAERAQVALDMAIIAALESVSA
jgi:hypothetical protein